MRTSYRVFILAVLVALLIAPLWFDKPFEIAPSIAQRFESLLVPTATAAVLAAPAVMFDATSAPQPGFDAAKLVMVGTMLFGLAAVVRKAI
jgi:hypothetical protein